MSTSVQMYSLAGKDAAAKEREDRLLAAKKKLKLYRARTSQRISNASASTTATDSSPRKDLRRQSGILTNGSISSKAEILGIHQHRRSLSKTGFLAGDGVKGHGRRVSKSRASRGSISGFGAVGKAGHGHTRSRASISISMSSPAVNQDGPMELNAVARMSAAPGAPSSWQQQSAFPTSSESARPLSAQLANLPLRPTSPLPPPSAPGPPLKHGRHGSRHTRRSSVSNFRESLEIVSGANQPLPSGLHANISSFAAPTAHGSVSPAPLAASSPLPAHVAPPAWSNDPRQVLEALKERGRWEEEGRLSPEQTRESALEALEGRVSAPSPVISLGREEPGELLSAPGPAPGTALSPLPPQGFSSSPMIGLGVGVASKRNSWGAAGGSTGAVTAMGGQGAMELGGIVEEDEEEEEERRSSTPFTSPRRINSSSPRKRPDSTRSRDEVAPTSRRSSIRPLSLSLSSTLSSTGTPSTSQFVTSSRIPSGPPSPVDERTAHSPGEKRHISVFHSVAATQLGQGLPASPNLSSAASSPSQRGGLRSLSIGNNASSSASLLDRRFPSRSASVGNSATLASPIARKPLSPLPSTKRSSISYRTDSGTPEPIKRASRYSNTGFGVAPTSPSVSTSTYSSFPFGVTGGFGDLEVDDDMASVHSRPTSFIDTASTEAELAAVRAQLEQLELRHSQVVATHALEISEFEKKASEEAGEMRSRIADLERQLADERTARRIEVEGLQREVSMAKEAVVDLTDERDSLREDVDGWRSRCNKLEANLKKEREDEALAEAQGKLIGEMRDQIYTLVAALERERGEHGETRKEVERMLEERVREAVSEVKAVKARSHDVTLDMSSQGIDEEEDDDDVESSLGMGSRHHEFKTTSDGSLLSSSSFSHSFSGNTTEDTSIGTDLDDSFSHKLSSPHSGHSSFNSVPSTFGSAPNSVRGRDSDVAAALGQLDTLAEEDEEDEEAALGGNSLSHDERVRLDSSGSQVSASTASDVMPRTPDKASSDHNRSHSFIRHWSFPKGSVCSSRVSYDEEDSSFFGYNKHDSLPPLPISDNILPPFLTASLDVDEATFDFFPTHRTTGSSSSHARRPSSPRPLDRMNPHARRFSGQYAMRAPPVSPSALVTAALQKQQQHPALPSPTSSVSPSKSMSRLSFGALLGSLGGWSPSGSSSVSSLPAPATAKLGLANSHALVVEEEEAEDEDEAHDDREDDVVVTTSSAAAGHYAYPHQSQRPMRYIKPTEVPRPVAARLGVLNFVGSACCADRPVFVV
ncbi:hypothetical protein JCM10212_006929 [Sporobolomyces blumeae]